MNLNAYLNIPTVSEIAIRNGIVVPRLRGYELMKDKEPATKQEIQEQIDFMTIRKCEDGCCCRFTFHNWHEYSSRTRAVMAKYLVKNPAYCQEEYAPKWIGIRWDKIHGRKRKNLKFAIKKHKRAIIAQTSVYNKYCGRQDVLYVHARIGGGNWPFYCEEVVSNPRFIEKVDDSFDSTYCDLYFRIEVNEDAD